MRAFRNRFQLQNRLEAKKLDEKRENQQRRKMSERQEK